MSNEDNELLQLWICGKPLDQRVAGDDWKFISMHTCKREAIEACTFDNYFIAPDVLDETWPNDWNSWPGLYYPNMKSKD